MSLASQNKREVKQLRVIMGNSAASEEDDPCNENYKNFPKDKTPSYTRNSSAVNAMKSNFHSQQPGVVQLEIGLGKLEELFNKGELCAADVRCTNCTSKMCIWNLCLSVCARRMQNSTINSDLYECCKQHLEKTHKGSPVDIYLKHENLEHI
jgi:hypothetical protein